jgi:hypothetical protein
LCLFLNTNFAFATDEYFEEFRSFKETFKAFYNFEEGLNPDFLKDEPNKPELNNHRAILRSCMTNDLEHLYLSFLPIFKKHLTLTELKSLRHNLETNAGRKYIQLSQNKIKESSLTEDEIIFMNSSFNSPEMESLVLVSEELITNIVVLTNEFIAFCINKEAVAK